MKINILPKSILTLLLLEREREKKTKTNKLKPFYSNVCLLLQYDFYFLVIAKLLHDQYFGLLDFYFHTLNQQSQENNRVLRGGSWDNNPVHCRSACRLIYVYIGRDYRKNYIGFRVLCVVGRTQ
jgi:hypothetical protein